MSCFDKNLFFSLNKEINSENQGKERVVDPYNFDLFSSSLEVVTRTLFTPDKIESIGPIKAIVYYKEEIPFLDQARQFFGNVQNSIEQSFCVGEGYGGDSNGVMTSAMKVYPVGMMPISSTLPKFPYEFNSLPDTERKNAINQVVMMPTVFVHSSDEYTPEIGDIVYIQFENNRTLANPTFVKKAGQAKVNIGADTYTSTSSAFSGCSDLVEHDARSPSGDTEGSFMEKAKAKLQSLEERQQRAPECTSFPRVSGGSAGVENFQSTSTTVEIKPSKRYSQNRVRLDSFAPGKKDFSNMVKLPEEMCYAGRTIYVHSLVYPRLVALSNHWQREFGGKVIDSFRQHNDNPSKDYFLRERDNGLV